MFSFAAFLAAGSHFYVRELVMAFGIGMGGFGGQSLCLVTLAQKVQEWIEEASLRYSRQRINETCLADAGVCCALEKSCQHWFQLAFIAGP